MTYREIWTKSNGSWKFYTFAADVTLAGWRVLLASQGTAYQVRDRAGLSG